MIEDILEIKNLSIRKRNKKDSLVDSINISVKKGEVVALVGESGAGKSITSLSILKLLYQGLGLEVNGEINLALNNDLINLSQSDKDQINKIRKEKIGMVFQEPQTALNPVLTCGKQVSEAVLNTDHLSITKKLLYSFSNILENILFKLLNKEVIIIKKSSFNLTKKKVLYWFEKLNIEQPLLTYNKYPHELSGGQKQRVIIAMALIKDPILLIADEPTTALDKFTQDILLHDLRKLQKENSLSILFVSHDLNLVKSIADKIYIMKDGKIIESGSIEDIFQKPKHLYTRDLIASCPPKDKKLSELPTRKHFMGFDEEGYFGDEAHLQDKSNAKPYFGDEAHFHVLPPMEGYFGDEMHLQETPDGKGFFGDEMHFQELPFTNTFFGDEMHSFPPTEYDILIHAQGYKVHRQSLSLAGEQQTLSPVMKPTRAQIQNGKIALSEPITFNEDSTALAVPAVQTLTDLLDVMKEYPAIGSIQIDSLLGNSDTAIRAQRAQVIQQFAIEQGFSSAQLMFNPVNTKSGNQLEVPITHVRQNMQNGLFVIQSLNP